MLCHIEGKTIGLMREKNDAGVLESIRTRTEKNTA